MLVALQYAIILTLSDSPHTLQIRSACRIVAKINLIKPTIYVHIQRDFWPPEVHELLRSIACQRVASSVVEISAFYFHILFPQIQQSKRRFRVAKRWQRALAPISALL